MILGIGIDLIEVARIKKAVAKTGFREKVFSSREIDYCEKDKTGQSYAARVAAKEAFFKALGTGWRDGMQINEVEILNDALGKPQVHLGGEAFKVFKKKKGRAIHITLSHIKKSAVAFVIIES